MYNAAFAALGNKFIAINTYIKKKKFQINNLTLHLRNQKNQKKNKQNPRLAKKKKTTKMTEISEIEARKTILKINKIRVDFLKR